MAIEHTQPGENETVETTNATAEDTTKSTPTAEHAEPSGAENAPAPRRRGFAAMDRDRVKAIASKGGRAAHAAGTAHQFSADDARVAGKKGGMAPHVRRGGVRRRPVAENGPSSQQHPNGQSGR